MGIKKFETEGFLSKENGDLIRVWHKDSIKVTEETNYTKRVIEPVKKIVKCYNSDGKLVGIDVHDFNFDELEIIHKRKTGETIVILKDEEGKKYKGVARCHPDDIYDGQMGFNLASLRAKKKMYEARLKECERQLNEEFWSTWLGLNK